MKKIFFLLLFVPLYWVSHAQMNGTFGNEWIDYNQKYYKIKIVKDGIYVINYNDLSAAGISTSEIASINPNNIQIYYRGLELPIYVSAQGSSQFSNNDWIEFFGRRNDGKLDQPLFQKPGWQPQNYNSFYNDTSVYFLTWSNSRPGKRLLYHFENDYSNYTPLEYHIQRGFTTYGTYYDGLNYTSELKYHQSSNYTEGEGFISGFIWNKATLSLAFNVGDIYKSGAGLSFKTEVFGVREPVYKSANGYHHHVFCKLYKTVGKSNITLDSSAKLFTQYEHPVYQLNIPDNKIDTGTMAVTAFLNIINDLGITYDITYIQKMEFEYPRKFKMRGTSQKLYNIPDFGTSNQYIYMFDYGNGSKNNVYLYDFENGLKARCTVNGKEIQVLTKGASKERQLYLADSTDRLSIGLMQPAIFTKTDITSGKNYLIVSHKQFAPSTIKYAQYRDSTFKTSVVWMDELYDQFCYGYNSPLAIRNYCNYMLQNNSVKPAFLLLIGKGIQTDFAKIYSTINFVPTWGVPGSDIPITSGLDGTTFEPAIPTGRIPAVIDSQVLVYLTKVRIYEKEINTLALWKKGILHTGGGLDKFQTDDLRSQMKQMQAIAEGDSFGANFSEYYKFQSVPVTGSLTDAIRDELKNGKSFTFYFGHGASDRMEIDMGDPQDATNLNKMPVMMSAGCLLGNSYYASTPQMGEKWLFAHKEKGKTIDAYGAIGWIGNSWYGYLYQLSDYFRNYYNNAFYKNYGKSIGEILKQTIVDNQDTNSSLIESHCKQVVIMGDPAIKLYSPKFPDYLLANKNTAVGIPASLSIFPENTTAVSDSFAVKITIYNQGRTQDDSIYVRVSRKFPDGKNKTYADLLVPAPKFSKDIYFWIQSKDVTTKGLNRFTVTINPDKKVNENGAYNNNSMTLDFNIPDNNASILYPYNFSIVSAPNIKITAQSIDQSNKTSNYIFELDTNYKFSSTFKKSQTISGQGLVYGSFTLLPQDSQPYYIRVKLADTIYKVWDEHTFTYIKNTTSGWAQVDYPQYSKSLADQIFMNNNERNYSFSSMSSNTYYFYSVGVNRDPGRNFTARVFRKNNGENMAINGGQVKFGWGLVAIDPSTETPWMPNNKYQYISPTDVYGNSIKTKTPVYLFDSTAYKPSVVADLKAFIDSIPDGYRVFVLKGENTGLNSYSSQTLQMFVSIGSNLTYLKKIKDEWPLCIKGFKNRPGSAYHVTADTLDRSISPDKQIVIISDQLGVKFTQGSLTSERIGPAKKWEKLFSKAEGKDNSQDKFSYSLITVDKDGYESYPSGYQNITTDSIDISNVSADLYPFLKIKTNYSDDSSRTPEHLKYWIINYKGVPEGTVLNNINKSWLPKDSITEGDSVRFKFPFQNISTFDFDSVMVSVTLTDFMNNQSVIFNEKSSTLKSGDTLFFQKAFSTRGLIKKNQLSITFNPNFAQPEQYLNNNTYSASFYVKRDLENPLIDVTFDGIRIFDGDLVSSSPKILITATDENKNYLISDTSQMEINLSFPDGHTERLSYSNPWVKFSPAEPEQRKASVEFNPEKLSDGDYILSAQATDASGNKAGAAPYAVKFKVNGKPSITRFFPYPNPFTNKAHFVFTITGEQVPQEIRIQIMTISGVVVREIFKDELGPLHIGNNTTSFAWDGTDQYGDKLGNGVYLYKVTARLNGKDMDLSTDDNDVFFKKGYGKIVLIR